jgi:dTDP-4-dehydrorhamnose reductase
MKPRILLIGAQGQVAWELRRTLSTLGDLMVAGRSGTDLHVDLADPRTIAPLLASARPDWIINAAAYTAVDKAETDAELAMAVNGEAVGVLAAEARAIGARVVHYSTDYVFDGRASRPYSEDDPPCPVSVYGHSKLAGETQLQDASVSHLILRTSWVYGVRGSNFLLTMRRLARERDALTVVADQLGAPTWSRHIAQATTQILAKLGTNDDAWARYSGIYHVAAGGQCSWFDFAQRIIEHQKKHEAIKVNSLDPIPTEAYPTPAARPAYSVLDTSKMARVFDVFLPDWTCGVDLVLEELV